MAYGTTADTPLRLVTPTNSDRLVTIASAGTPPVVANANAKQLTGADADIRLDPRLILAGTSDYREQAALIKIPPGINQVLLYLVASHTAFVTMTTPADIRVFGRMPGSSEAGLLPSINAAFPALTTTQQWRGMADVDANYLITLPSEVVCKDGTGTEKQITCGHVRVPVYGIEELLVSILTVAAPSDASASVMVMAQGVA